MLQAMRSAKKNILILAGTLLAITAAWYGLIIRPQQVDIDTLGSDIEQLIRMVEAATVEQKQVLVLQDQVKTLSDSLASLESRLFTREQVPDILRQMVQNGMGNHLQFTGIYPKYDQLLTSNRQDHSPLQRLPIEMVFSGPFQRVGRFVENLQQQQFLFSIDRIEMAVSPELFPAIRVVVRGTLFLKQLQNENTTAFLNTPNAQINHLVSKSF